jgi:hypothetical protein
LSAIHGKEVPVNAVEMVVAEQPINPELVEDPGFAPFLKAPVGRGMVADAGCIESAPLAARARYKENRVHGVAVGHRRIVAAQGVRLSRGQELLHLLPEFIGDAPAVVFDYESHKKKCSFLEQNLIHDPAASSPNEIASKRGGSGAGRGLSRDGGIFPA